MSEKILSGLESVFRDLFDDEFIVLEPETTASDVVGWDSLMQLRLIAEIEKRFRLSFSVKEISNLANVGEMARLIQEKGGHFE